MKILFLCGDMNRSGGTERAAALIANGLARSGFDITLLSIYGGSKPFFDVLPTVELDALFSTPGRFLKRYPLIIWRLRKAIIDKKIDVLIDVESMLALVSIPAITGLGLRHICWEHFNFNVNLGKKGRTVARHLAARFCDDILTLTERDKSMWQRGTKLKAAIRSIPNPSPFRIQAAEYPIDSKTVIAIGRPIYQKGYDLMLCAWRLASTKAEGWKLRIIGCGDEEEEKLKELCINLGIEASVELVPATNNIAKHYSDAAIYCLSSRTEGLPLVLIEALAFGLPIVSFDCDTGPREVLAGCGIDLVPQGNIEALSESLLELMNDPAKRLMLSGLAKVRAKDFQPEKIMSQWMELLGNEIPYTPETAPLSATAGPAGDCLGKPLEAPAGMCPLKRQEPGHLMRIMHIISSPSAGGAEIYVKDLAIAMAEKKHDIRILFLNKASDIGRDTEFEKKFLARLTEKGISYDFIGYRARKNPFFGIYRTCQIARSFQPDIIHCHLYYAAVFALFTHGAKLIYTHHSIHLRTSAFIYKLLDLRMATYIGICDACDRMLQKITRKPVVHIDNAVEQHRMLPRASRQRLDRAAPTILVVGRLSKEKNLSLLLQALVQLNDLQFKVNVAGEGPERTNLEQQVKQLGLTEKVRFMGNVDNVPALMSGADIYAMCSTWEGLPIALIEATLTGLPLIVTNVGGCPEVVHHVGNGIVVNELTPTAYASGLRSLIESRALRNRLSDNALNNSERYRLSTSVNAHLALYGRLAFPLAAV